jgi:GTP-binding protein HflX
VALSVTFNAGKSTLMRASPATRHWLPTSFATSTTVRAPSETVPRVLVSDTVGHKNLPHAIASFKSTLDEAWRVVPSSRRRERPGYARQLAVTEEVRRNRRERTRRARSYSTRSTAAATKTVAQEAPQHQISAVATATLPSSRGRSSSTSGKPVEAEPCPWSAQNPRGEIFRAARCEERAGDDGTFFRVRGEPEARKPCANVRAQQYEGGGSWNSVWFILIGMARAGCRAVHRPGLASSAT